ncbi:MAG: transporter substrate-binding domain-containing protein, partial [Motiliproteus sp.]
MLINIFCILILLFSVAPLRAETQLSLATDDWPPYEFVDVRSGKLNGLSTEIIRAVFERMGLPEPEIELYPWARAEQEAFVGSVDGIYSITPSPERLRHLLFPDEPLTTEQGVLFVRKDRVGLLQIDSVDDLKRLNIGVVRGYAYSSALWMALDDFGNFSAVTQEEQLFQMLALKRFDAVVSYRNTGVGMVRRLSLSDQIEPYEGYVLFAHSFYLAFNRNKVKSDVVQAFSRQLVAFKKTGAYRQLLQKYLTTHDPLSGGGGD